jgi:dTDP-L-rhamnose 4-epimerase
VNKVLITGGAGFIGSHLTKSLVGAGYGVRILDCLAPQIHGQVPTALDWIESLGVEFIRGSVSDQATVRKVLRGVDTIIHLAAETGTGQSMYEIAHYNNVNIGGTATLLDVLANDRSYSVKRLVLASSRSIYGEGSYICVRCNEQKRHYPDARKLAQLTLHRWEHTCTTCGNDLEPVATREEDSVKPASIYAATKYAQENLVRVACSALGVDYAILRLQNVYGEGQSLNNPYTGILSIFSTRIRRGQYLPIFEDGLETRDFVHVQDVANSFLAAIQFSGTLSDVINVGTGVKTTVAEIAAHLSKAFGTKPNLITTKEYRLGDIRHNFADIARLRTKLDYHPVIDLDTGMERFSNWVLQQSIPEDKLDYANKELKSRGLMGG